MGFLLLIDLLLNGVFEPSSKIFYACLLGSVLLMVLGERPYEGSVDLDGFVVRLILELRLMLTEGFLSPFSNNWLYWVLLW